MAANSGGSAGGLFLQVKLQTDQIERQIKELGRKYEQAFAGPRAASAQAQAGARAVERQTAAMQQQAQLAEVVARKQEATAAKAAKTAEREAARAEKARKREMSEAEAIGRRLNREYDARVAAQDRATRAALSSALRQTQAAERQYQQERRLALQLTRDIENERKKQEKAAQRAADKATKAAEQEAKARRGLGSILGAGSQELFVGLGAARSGNIFYGLAAGARYAKNLGAAMEGASGFTRVLATGVAAATAAVAAFGVAIGAVTYRIGRFGVEQAAGLEMLNLQLTGLLGSAERAQREMQFLLQLGKESIVPTQSLIEASRQLLAFGVTADDTRRSLVQFFSDFGTATGASEQQVYYLSLALGQVAAIGKANSVDMRQLANAGINTMQVYGIIADRIGMSAREVAEGVADGIVTADLLFAALTEYGTKFAATAEQARASTQGLLSNIADTIRTNVGLAFADVNRQVADFLQSVLEAVNRINFDNIARAIGQVIDYFGQVLGNFGASSDSVVDVFNTTLPNAINETGYALARLTGFLKVIGDIIGIVGRIGVAAGSAVSGAFSAALIPINAIGIALGNTTPADVEAAMDATEMFKDIAVDNLNEVIDKVGELNAAWEIDPMKQLLITPPMARGNSGGYSGIPSTKGGADGVFKTSAPDWDKILNDWRNRAGGSGAGASGGGAAENKALERARAWVDKFSGILGDAAKAREDMQRIVSTPFGEPSEIQQALTSGDTSSISRMGVQLAEQLAEMYAPLENAALAGKEAAQQAFLERGRLTGELIRDTATLMNLAKANRRILEEELPKLDETFKASEDRIKQQIADLDKWRDQREDAIRAQYEPLLESANTALEIARDRYEEANSALEELLRERDQFLSTAAQSLRSFVNDLSVAEELVDRYTRLDAAGSFALEQEKRTGSFKDALQQRLDAVRTWTANIRSLLSRGLNSDLVRQFVAGGIGSSADVVSQLAGADSATLAAINDIQAQLQTEIDGFTRDASAAWFDSGVAQAEAYVAPLRAAYQDAQAEVTRLQTEQQNALNVLKASYDEQKALAETNLATLRKQYDDQRKQLEDMVKANEDAAKTVADNIQARFSQIGTDAVANGVSMLQGLIDGIKDENKNNELIGAVRGLARRIKRTFEEALGIASPSKVTMQIGQYVAEGLSVGMAGGERSVAAAAARLAVSAVPMPTLASVVSARPSQVAGAPVPAGDLGGLSGASFNVQVFVGDRELTDIVDTRILAADGRSLDYVTAGRRF